MVLGLKKTRIEIFIEVIKYLLRFCNYIRKVVICGFVNEIKCRCFCVFVK